MYKVAYSKLPSKGAGCKTKMSQIQNTRFSQFDALLNNRQDTFLIVRDDIVVIGIPFPRLNRVSKKLTPQHTALHTLRTCIH